MFAKRLKSFMFLERGIPSMQGFNGSEDLAQDTEVNSLSFLSSISKCESGQHL